jgi:hypothetical protein
VPSLDIELNGRFASVATVEFAVGELGGQQPLKDVVVSIGDMLNAGGKRLDQIITAETPASYNLTVLPAGDEEAIAFAFWLPLSPPDTFTGKAYVTTSNAGSLEIEVTINLENPYAVTGRRWVLYE